MNKLEKNSAKSMSDLNNNKKCQSKLKSVRLSKIG
jgi:hypothetical protein